MCASVNEIEGEREREERLSVCVEIDRLCMFVEREKDKV